MVDEQAVERVRGVVRAVVTEAEVTERRMFGGVAFLLDGSMAVAVSGRTSTDSGGLMVRVPAEGRAALLAQDGVHPVLMRGSQMRGWVLVDLDGLADAALHAWVDRGRSAAVALPAR